MTDVDSGADLLRRARLGDLIRFGGYPVGIRALIEWPVPLAGLEVLALLGREAALAAGAARHLVPYRAGPGEIPGGEVVLEGSARCWPAHLPAHAATACEVTWRAVLLERPGPDLSVVVVWWGRDRVVLWPDEPCVPLEEVVLYRVPGPVHDGGEVVLVSGRADPSLGAG